MITSSAFFSTGFLCAGFWLSSLISLWSPFPQNKPPAEPPSGKVLVIPLSDEGKYMVDQVQAEFIIDKLDRAEAEGVERIILKIDTFGGVVFSAREISERLLRLAIPTTAYVETKAISAGVFIAWATDEIIMEANTTLGDAQMIMQTIEGKIEEAPEKLLSVYRSDWKKASDAKQRSFALAQGFFQADTEVLMIGQEDDFRFMLRDDYDLLPAEEREPILRTIAKKGQLLTLHAGEVQDLGIGRVVADFETYLAQIGVDQGSVQYAVMSLNQNILRFLGSNSWLFMVLTLIGLNGLYMEIKAPGFGIPGFTAIVCFTIVFGSRYFLGTAEPLEMVLFALGILLCFAEIFVLPGLGVAGVAGLACLFGALVLASLPDLGQIPDPGLRWDWIAQMIGFTLTGFVLSLGTLFLVFPLLFKLPMAQKHMVPMDMNAVDGYVMKTVSEQDVLGKTGTVHGGLRPSGKMLAEDGSFLDVVSEGNFIDHGTPIHIVRLDGNLVVVRPHSATSPSISGS